MDSIDIRFDDIKSASLAIQTLQEIGYRVKPMLRIRIARADLTSALEISQAYGGTLEMAEEEHRPLSSASKVYQSAYTMDEFEAIPAHLTTEDLDEAYMHPDSDL